MKRFVQLAAALLFTAAPASATVQLNTNDSGILTGATGVDIGGFLYNVTFSEGTCASVFGACNDANFDFSTLASASLAAQALLSQVFINSSLGEFDTNTTLTFGCAGSEFCFAAIPYAVGTGVNAGTFFGAIAVNRSLEGPDSVGSINGSISGFSTVNNSNFVFANFTATGVAAVPAVPEPATWAMMLMGFGAVGVCLRGRRRVGNLVRAA